VHIVLFKYKPTTTPVEKQWIATSFLGLKNTCERDGSKYILSIDGGLNNSTEGKTQGMEVRVTAAASFRST
jgi:hypothetical protein